MTASRYNTIAVWLHWIIAAAIVVQLGLGWWMNEVMPDHTPAQAAVEGVHISLGLTILLLVLARIVVRLIYRPPPLPAGMPAWERWLAHAVHLAFYLLLLALPLSGWTLVSMGAHPISFWGLPWPHLPGVAQAFGPSPSRGVRHLVKHTHVFILVWLLVISLALHIAGALKHQFDGRPVLWRITGLKAPA